MDCIRLTVAVFLVIISSLTESSVIESNVIGVAEPSATTSRPPYYEYARRARYIMHRADWAMLTTFSSKPELLGRSFPCPASVADGPVDNSTGTPYFYQASIGSVMKDLDKNPNITLSFSEAEFDNIKECAITANTDPENPPCSRLMLFGKVVHITDTTELAFAKQSLFSRHPVMSSWPSSHDFVFTKMVIDNIWMLDYFGGAIMVSVKDYYNAKP